MKNQTQLPQAGIGNMGQPLYAVPHPAPPMNGFDWLIIIIYGLMLLFIVSIIFGAGYWLGHLLAIK